eukprot:TRINITY_DN14659_c0_g1_i1.p1 TRINITY_DN14659_c0_g1~~TRINITY_DN14659_c0_g1_i1.p1  ORF type:complete len:104 (+),score=14.88 TRINITY_DN14659_c0_g1_i1:103-414(+)
MCTHPQTSLMHSIRTTTPNDARPAARTHTLTAPPPPSPASLTGQLAGLGLDDLHRPTRARAHASSDASNALIQPEPLDTRDTPNDTRPAAHTHTVTAHQQQQY